jgi:hypothetical protein
MIEGRIDVLSGVGDVLGQLLGGVDALAAYHQWYLMELEGLLE